MPHISSDTSTILEPGLEISSLPELFSQCTRLREATSMATGEIFRWDAPNGRSYLVKSFARKSWFSRIFFGRISIGREWRMLNYLHQRNFSAAPCPVKKIGHDTILMEFIPGSQLHDARRYEIIGQELPPKEFFLNIKNILSELHTLGVSHGDFRRANILLQSDGRPRLIDWATARTKDTGLGFLHRQLLRSDNYSLVKILTDVYPDLLTEEERAKAKPGLLLRLGRFLRQNLYRRFIKPFRKKHHHRARS